MGYWVRKTLWRYIFSGLHNHIAAFWVKCSSGGLFCLDNPIWTSWTKSGPYVALQINRTGLTMISSLDVKDK